VDRNAITVRWAYMRQIIPLPAIMQIAMGQDLPVGKPGWLHWPVPYLRSVGREGAIQLFATRPPAECVLFDTADGTYALSPADPQAMVATVQERYAMGPSQVLAPGSVRTGRWNRLLPAEKLGIWLLAGGLLGVLTLFGVLMISFPNLPDVLTVRYNSAGLPEEIREKSALYRLPIIGFLAWGINGAAGMILMARRQPMAAYMLWSGALVVQVFSLLALVSLIT
jgi:hypothetical protein